MQIGSVPGESVPKIVKLSKRYETPKPLGLFNSCTFFFFFPRWELSQLIGS